MRYKVWRSNKDKELHLLCADGAEAFEALPAAIRDLGPWIGSKEGDVERLRLPYRVLLNEQGFVIIPKLQLESVAGVHMLHPATTDCPECKGKGASLCTMASGTRNARVAAGGGGSRR
jgi:hypothetical protein